MDGPFFLCVGWSYGQHLIPHIADLEIQNI